MPDSRHRVFESRDQAQITDDAALHLHADDCSVTRIDEFGEVHSPDTNLPLYREPLGLYRRPTGEIAPRLTT